MTVLDNFPRIKQLQKRLQNKRLLSSPQTPPPPPPKTPRTGEIPPPPPSNPSSKTQKKNSGLSGDINVAT